MARPLSPHRRLAWLPLALLSWNVSVGIDLTSVQPDLTVPPLLSGSPRAGARVLQTHPNYTHTSVYHTLYLPEDWKAGERYPVVVEYAGNGPYQNAFGDVSTGRVEGSRLGYGLTAGQGCLWLCLPYLDEAGEANVRQWWGESPSFSPEPTLRYAKQTVPWICQRYGGDPDRIVLCGFSRGAIACNYLGLHDDEIASLWTAFIPFSHYDGVNPRWGYPQADKESARTRLQRLGKRPQFILHEVAPEAKWNLEATRAYLQQSGIDLSHLTFRETGFRNHSDAWILRPSPARKALRRWFAKVIAPKDRPSARDGKRNP